jgi:hypothetical protein
MPFKRGQPKIGGRKAGTPNKRTVAKSKAVQEAIKCLQAGSGSFAGDGYALLTAVYKSEDFDLSVRLDAAKAVMAFERPRLSNIEMTHRSLDSMSEPNPQVATATEVFLSSCVTPEALRSPKRLRPLSTRSAEDHC